MKNTPRDVQYQGNEISGFRRPGQYIGPRRAPRYISGSSSKETGIQIHRETNDFMKSRRKPMKNIPRDVQYQGNEILGSWKPDPMDSMEIAFFGSQNPDP